MTSPRNPLFTLTAGDLMTPAVMTLPEEMRLPAAARLLRGRQVSGAPVVDSQGRCTGVLSSSDFMHWAEGDSPRPRSHCHDNSLFTAWQNPELKEMPHDEVRDYMTADPVMVVRDTPLARMAELMMEAHVHRLIVVDAELHPVGVVTTTDILTALIREARTTI